MERALRATGVVERRSGLSTAAKREYRDRSRQETAEVPAVSDASSHPRVLDLPRDDDYIRAAVENAGYDVTA